MAAIGHNQTCRHIERRRLTGTVRTEQTDNLTLSHVETDIVYNRALTIAFYEPLGTQYNAFLFHYLINLPAKLRNNS